MSLTRTHPFSSAFLGRLDTTALAPQLGKLHKMLEEAESARSEWMNKQEKLLRQRKGVRKPKVFPWKGANNHNWPIMDGTIRRWKPGVTALILGADPVCYFFPTNPRAMAAAPDAQAYYHWRFHQIDGMEETVYELADYVAQHGLAYTLQCWDYRTRRVCRVCQVTDLFPQGVEAAYEQYAQAIAQQTAALSEAVATGQAPPDVLAQAPVAVPLQEFVVQVLETEYNLRQQNPLETEQLLAAAQAILQGAERVKFYYHVVIADRPQWMAFSPFDVIVPPRMDDPATAEFLGLVYRLTTDDVRVMANDGWFDAEPAEEVARRIEQRQSVDAEREQLFGRAGSSYRQILNVLDQSEGLVPGEINDPNRDLFLRIYTKMDVDGDLIKEQVVLWYHPATKTVLSIHPYVSPFPEWPIVRFEFEHNSRRPYQSRGVAELLTVFQATVNKMHNSRLDAMQITLSPMFQMRASAGNLKRNIRFMPGQIIPVSQVGDFARVDFDVSGLLQSLTEENLTKNLAENYIGIFDPGILALNPSERRTAAEVDAVVTQTQSVFGQDAQLFQVAMRKVHRQLWKLIMEFGPAEEYFRVTGVEQPKLARKFELDMEYDLVPSGTPANTSRQLAMRRAAEALQLFLPDQTGLIDKHQLFKWYFDILDHNRAKLIVRPPEAAAAVQQVMQAASVANGGQEVAAF